MKTKTLDSTKIYWLDKEETVKVKLVGLDMPHGFGSAKYTFRVVFGGAGDIVYMDSNLPKTLHEVMENNPWSFTAPIAMKCTEEQFNVIRYRLFEMGYKISTTCSFKDCNFLVNNLSGKVGVASNVGWVDIYAYNRAIFETFNPDLFLGLAAMTDKEDGIKGEWWRYTDDMQGPIVAQKYLGEFTVPNKAWRKATAQEIINYFKKKVLNSPIKTATEDTLTKLLNQFEANLKHALEIQEKEFVLRSRWYVQLTSENYELVKRWHEKIDKCIGRDYTVGAYYGVYEDGSGDCWAEKEMAERYQIITTDQFKKYALKEPTPPTPNEILRLTFALKLRDPFKYLESKTIIPIPSGRQANLFEDRVEITDWKPKEGEEVFVVTSDCGLFLYKKVKYNTSMLHGFQFHNGFIFRTESDAKSLVEKLKKAML